MNIDRFEFGGVGMFKGFSNGVKTGLVIMGIAGIIMLLEVLFEKPVLDLVVWLFFLGMAITLISSFVMRRKKNTNSNLVKRRKN